MDNVKKNFSDELTDLTRLTIAACNEADYACRPYMSDTTLNCARFMRQIDGILNGYAISYSILETMTEHGVAEKVASIAEEVESYRSNITDADNGCDATVRGLFLTFADSVAAHSERLNKIIK